MKFRLLLNPLAAISEAFKQSLCFWECRNLGYYMVTTNQTTLLLDALLVELTSVSQISAVV